MKKIKRGTDSALEIKNKEATSLPKLLIDGEIKQFRRLWKVDIKRMRTRERQNITQDNVRLKRIKDRAKGVRFALGYGLLGFRKRKEMEQTLRNLELAATAINKELKREK
ncbi:MAG: hypothetical protein VYA19_03300 [Pseudomonadota bacterium]|nr:hypothetical protein [Pseudomonadota bacterium]MEC7441757.1 hypothetical protein [Pseudomonadota bacterium]MEC7659723.1 hypothetical protein [Pseudomonadota bacterium]MEC8750912.1 hypothetical protein [Pseudomonadota bacterium]MEE3008022.1 hypothetical protein [Pseudomonadota bacterium]